MRSLRQLSLLSNKNLFPIVVATFLLTGFLLLYILGERRHVYAEESDSTELIAQMLQINKQNSRFARFVKIVMPDGQEMITQSEGIFASDIVTESDEIQNVINALDKGITYEVDCDGTPLKFPFEVQLYELREVEEIYEEDIEYEIIEQKDNSELIGTKKVVQEGIAGTARITKRKTFKNGALIKDELLSKEILEQPTEKIVIAGTKQPSTQPKGCTYWNGYVDSLGVSQAESNWLKPLMRCESTCNPGASNGVNHGLLQFHPNTYTRHSGKNIWDGYEQIEIALRLYRSGGAGHWPTFSIRNGRCIKI